MHINPDYFVYGGGVCFLLGVIFLLFFLFNRGNRIIKRISGKEKKSSRKAHALRRLLFLIVWIAVFGMVMFYGFFMRTYYRFTLEEPVAEIRIQTSDSLQTNTLVLTQFISPDSQITQQFLIKGDQWTLEGDILKWDNWLNFVGLHTRYRLTRVRGRYLSATEELAEKPTVYPLVEDEPHPFWAYLYEFGHKLPFVSTVYGNAVFQSSADNKVYQVFVSTSGFVVREKTKK